jgi:hypothetical protein
MNSLKIQNATKGRVVFTVGGKEVPETHPDGKARINGPHTDAKWAQHLLGTYRTPTQRRADCRKAREQASFAKLWNKSNEQSKNPKFQKKIKAPVHA